MGKASRRARGRKQKSGSVRPVAKLSARLVELMEPYRKECEGGEEYAKLVTLASAAWNLSLFSSPEREETLARVLQAISAEDRPLAEAALTEFLLRKERLFPQDRRFIVSFEVVAEGGHYRVLVASISED